MTSSHLFILLTRDSIRIQALKHQHNCLTSRFLIKCDLIAFYCELHEAGVETGDSFYHLKFEEKQVEAKMQ